MSGKMHGGGVVVGSVGVSMLVRLVATTTGAPVTGVAFGSATAYYVRQGAAAQAVVLQALALITSPWASGGWIEVDAVHMPGLYRLDLPDAMWAAGSDWVWLSVGAAGAQEFQLEIVLELGDAFALLNDPVETIAAGNTGMLNYSGIQRLLVALLMGLKNGGNTGLIALRDQANLKNRATFTCDQNGNITAVTVDLT